MNASFNMQNVIGKAVANVGLPKIDEIDFESERPPVRSTSATGHYDDGIPEITPEEFERQQKEAENERMRLIQEEEAKLGRKPSRRWLATHPDDASGSAVAPAPSGRLEGSSAGEPGPAATPQRIAGVAASLSRGAKIIEEYPVVCLPTGTTYPSVAEAARRNRINVKQLRLAIEKGVEIGGLTFKRLEGATPADVHRQRREDAGASKSTTHASPVRMMPDGLVFTSRRLASLCTGIPYQAVVRSARSGETVKKKTFNDATPAELKEAKASGRFFGDKAVYEAAKMSLSRSSKLGAAPVPNPAPAETPDQPPRRDEGPTADDSCDVFVARALLSLVSSGDTRVDDGHLREVIGAARKLFQYRDVIAVIENRKAGDVMLQDGELVRL